MELPDSVERRASTTPHFSSAMELRSRRPSEPVAGSGEAAADIPLSSVSRASSPRANSDGATEVAPSVQNGPSGPTTAAPDTRISGLHEPIVREPDAFFEVYPLARKRDMVLFCRCLPFSLSFKWIVTLWIGGYTILMLLVEIVVSYAYADDGDCKDTHWRDTTIVAVCVAVALVTGHIALIVYFIMRITRPLRKLDEGMRLLISRQATDTRQRWEEADVFTPFPLIREAAKVHRELVDDLEKHKAEVSRMRDVLTIATNQRREAITRVAVLESMLEQHSEDAPCAVSVFCATWNAGNLPLPDSLSTWITTDADIVTVGVQECAIVSNIAKTVPLEAAFARLLQDALGRDYYMVHCANILGPSTLRDLASDSAGIRIFVFARRSLRSAISCVRSGHVRTGIAKVAYNKGAVSVSFALYGRTFCFINSHLAAHQEKVRERAEDYHRIVSRLDVGATDLYCTSEFDAVFWMGDLNYRIDLPRDIVLGHIAKEHQDPMSLGWEFLQRHDQLNMEREAGNAFAGFSEGPTNFPPTFKHDFGAATYESIKKRVPAWCDRVLWKSMPGIEVEQHAYDSARRLMVSDHRPVYARFVVRFVAPRPPSAIGANHYGLQILMATIVPLGGGGDGSESGSAKKLNDLLRSVDREKDEDKKDLPKRLVARFLCPDLMDPSVLEMSVTAAGTAVSVVEVNGGVILSTVPPDAVAWGTSDSTWDVWESRAAQVASRAVRVSVGVVRAEKEGKSKDKQEKAGNAEVPPSPRPREAKARDADGAFVPVSPSPAGQLRTVGSGLLPPRPSEPAMFEHGRESPIVVVSKGGVDDLPLVHSAPVVEAVRDGRETDVNINRRRKIGEGAFGLAQLVSAGHEQVTLMVPLCRGGRPVCTMRLVARCALIQNVTMATITQAKETEC